MSFGSKYRPDGEVRVQQHDAPSVSHLEAMAPGIGVFLGRYAGMSFNQGLYRIHSISEMPRWTATVADAFPDFKKSQFLLLIRLAGKALCR